MKCKWSTEIIEGLNYLHENLIMHRDLSVDNVLLDENTDIKICDFGLSTILERG
jgi:serine/threonine protein kinase